MHQNFSTALTTLYSTPWKEGKTPALSDLLPPSPLKYLTLGSTALPDGVQDDLETGAALGLLSQELWDAVENYRRENS